MSSLLASQYMCGKSFRILLHNASLLYGVSIASDIPHTCLATFAGSRTSLSTNKKFEIPHFNNDIASGLPKEPHPTIARYEFFKEDFIPNPPLLNNRS